MGTEPIVIYGDDLDYEAARELLSTHGYRLVRLEFASRSELRQAVGLLSSFAPIGPSTLAKLPSLRAISLSTSDANTIDLAEATKRNIKVRVVSGVSTEEVAVHTLALMLYGLRGLWRLETTSKQGYAAVMPLHRPSTLTLGVIGAGRIGRAVTILARPIFGRTVVWDPLDREAPSGSRVSFEELIHTVDLLTLHLALTPGTLALLDETVLKQTKPGLVLVNTARAGLIDPEALLMKLDHDPWAYAGLDVTDGYPPALATRLHAHKRVLHTPHCAFYSEESVTEYTARQVDNLVAALREDRCADTAWPPGGECARTT